MELPAESQKEIFGNIHFENLEPVSGEIANECQ